MGDFKAKVVTNMSSGLKVGDFGFSERIEREQKIVEF